MFYIAISRNFERFQYFKFDTNFPKNENLFQKTGVSLLVESSSSENASFPYKAAISEANVKTKRMVSTKWSYHIEWRFASNYFNLLKIVFQFKNL